MAHDFFIRSVEPVTRLAAGLALVMLALSAGCGRSDTVVGPNGERTSVKQKGDSVDVTFTDKQGKEGHVATGDKGVALPVDFPKDVAIYPGATPFMSSTDKAAKSVNVVLKTTDPGEKVAAFYKKKLADDGWNVNNTSEIEKLRTFQAAKGGRTVAVMIVGDTGETMITIVVTSEK